MRPLLALCGVTLLLLASPLLGQQSTVVPTPAGTRHEMVLVPEGSFTMGSDSGKPDERPVHTVHLDAFYIDKFEVTNASYLAFVGAVGNWDSLGHEYLDLNDVDRQIHYSGDAFELESSDMAQRPAVEVSWYGARAYCEWAGLRLPTEAMWEKAARGTDGAAYPWGEGITRSHANYGKDDCPISSQPRPCGLDDSDGYLRSAPVGSSPAGASPYGAHDMAGNVWEFVMDWYAEQYYSTSPMHDPQGPETGLQRVLRGGSYGSPPRRLRTTERSGFPQTPSSVIIGFRCAAMARDVPATSIAPHSWGQVKRYSAD